MDELDNQKEWLVTDGAVRVFGRNPALENHRFLSCDDGVFAFIDGGAVGTPTPAGVLTDAVPWAYRFLKRRPFCLKDKRVFISRIFRSANIAVFQQCGNRVSGDSRAAAEMAIVFAGFPLFWIGAAGDMSVFVYKGKTMDRLYPTPQTPSIASVGSMRYGFTPCIMPVECRTKTFIVLASGDMQTELSGLDTARVGMSEFHSFVVSHLQSSRGTGFWMLVETASRSGKLTS